MYAILLGPEREHLRAGTEQDELCLVHTLPASRKCISMKSSSKLFCKHKRNLFSKVNLKWFGEMFSSTYQSPLEVYKMTKKTSLASAPRGKQVPKVKTWHCNFKSQRMASDRGRTCSGVPVRRTRWRVEKVWRVWKSFESLFFNRWPSSTIYPKEADVRVSCKQNNILSNKMATIWALHKLIRDPQHSSRRPLVLSFQQPSFMSILQNWKRVMQILRPFVAAQNDPKSILSIREWAARTKHSHFRAFKIVVSKLIISYDVSKTSNLIRSCLLSRVNFFFPLSFPFFPFNFLGKKNSYCRRTLRAWDEPTYITCMYIIDDGVSRWWSPNMTNKVLWNLIGLLALTRGSDTF